MIKIVEVKRIARLEHATFGVILDDGVPFGVTLELPWKNNQRSVSCIPPSPVDPPLLYLCERFISRQHGSTFIVMDVPNRSQILCTHVGNSDEDTEGCILVAEEFGVLNGEPAILRSRQGFDEFRERLQGVNKFVLRVGWWIS